MKNYDDLQRFKEKTQTTAIDFKAFSAKPQSAEHSQWAIIRQLADHSTDPLAESMKRVGLAEAQPINKDNFGASSSQPTPTSSLTEPLLQAVSSIEATPRRQQQPTSHCGTLQSLFTSATAPPAASTSIEHPPVHKPVQPTSASKPGEKNLQFAALFGGNSTPSDYRGSVEEQSLQALLKRIAACH